MEILFPAVMIASPITPNAPRSRSSSFIIVPAGTAIRTPGIIGTPISAVFRTFLPSCITPPRLNEISHQISPILQ